MYSTWRKLMAHARVKHSEMSSAPRSHLAPLDPPSGRALRVHLPPQGGRVCAELLHLSGVTSMKMFSAVASTSCLRRPSPVAAPAAPTKPSRSAKSIRIRRSLVHRPYRKGWKLALEEINAAGGVDGKKLEVISKDDGGKPADAVTQANELVASDGVVMLAGRSSPTSASRFPTTPSRRRSCSSRPNRSPTRSRCRRAIATRSDCGQAPTSRPRCSRMKRPNCRRRNGRRSRPTTNTASPLSKRSRLCCRRSGPTCNGSASNGRRRAR